MDDETVRRVTDVTERMTGDEREFGNTAMGENIDLLGLDDARGVDTVKKAQETGFDLHFVARTNTLEWTEEGIAMPDNGEIASLARTRRLRHPPQAAAQNAFIVAIA